MSESSLSRQSVALVLTNKKQKTQKTKLSILIYNKRRQENENTEPLVAKIYTFFL